MKLSYAELQYGIRFCYLILIIALNIFKWSCFEYLFLYMKIQEDICESAGSPLTWFLRFLCRLKMLWTGLGVMVVAKRVIV